MKSVEDSANLDFGKFLRLGVLLLIITLFFWKQRRKSFSNIFANNIRHSLIFFVICASSALYAGNFVYPIAKSLELFVVIITGSLFVTARLEEGNVADDTRRLIYNIACFMLITSLCLNLYWYHAVYVYGYTSTTVGSAAVIAILAMNQRFTYKSLFMLTFLITSLIFSHSRTSLGFAFIAIPAVFYFKNRLNIWIATPLIFGTLLSIIFMFKEALMRNNSMELLLSLSGRLDHWAHAIDLIKSSPLIGYGYYYGVRVVATESYTAREGYEFSTLDNNYLDAIVSVGFFGLIPLLLFILKALKNGRMYLKDAAHSKAGPDVHSTASLMAIVLFCLLKAAMAPTFVFFHWNQIVMFLACISLLNLTMRKRQNDR